MLKLDRQTLRNIRLKTKFALLVVVLVAVALVVYLLFSVATQRSQTENELREKGLALSQQMDAVWQFMSANQDRLAQVAYTEDGSYQGLHCAIVGRSIGKLFSTETNYTTRFVNFNPRNDADEPDEFEARALEAFAEDASLTEYYGYVEESGEMVFRYSSPMKIEETCLQCHGGPAGEIDETGYPKEGWELGDDGGVISITIPLDIYQQAELENISNSVTFFVVLLIATVLILFTAISQLVTVPLGKFQEAFALLKGGELEVKLAENESSFELNMLAARFNEMAGQLSNVYQNLELQVEDRTVQLKEANEILRTQGEELEAINARLADDNEYKTNFLAMMSHELRTPLTSIIAFSEMLETVGAPRDEREAEIRQEISSNSRFLLLMINDILEINRLDAGRGAIDWEPVDLGDVMGMVQSVVQPLADRKGIEFTVEIESDVPLITADFEKLRHSIENLAGNAVKFTDAGHVSTVVSFHPECNEVWIAVEDTGIGIAKSDQKRIFERFTQADSSASRRYGGSGLGLALAKEYAEMHAGAITVESALGKGSRFVLRIPRKPVLDEENQDETAK